MRQRALLHMSEEIIVCMEYGDDESEVQLCMDCAEESVFGPVQKWGMLPSPGPVDG